MTRRQLIFVACAALLGKLLLAIYTYGTNDVETWQRFANGARDAGLQLYITTQDFNHPPSMIHFLRAVSWLSNSLSLPFPLVMRLPAIAADAGTLWLVWKMSGYSPALLLLAASPQLILISGFHGNTDSVMIFFVILAVYLVQRDKAIAGGAAFGLAICIKVVPVVLVPVFVLYLSATPRKSATRRRLQFLAAVCGLLLCAWAPFLYQGPGLIYRRVFGYTSIYGSWGISSLLERLELAGLSEMFYAHGRNLLLAMILIASVLMNRRARKPGLFAQVGVIFFIFLSLANGFGVQYLAWLAPFAVELGTLPIVIFYGASGAFLFLVYNYWSPGFPWYFADCNAIGGWEYSLDFFQTLCWLSVVIMTILAIRQMILGRRLQFTPRWQAGLLAGTVAVLMLGLALDRAAIPIHNPGSPRIGRVEPSMKQYYLDLADLNCAAAARRECAAALLASQRF